MSRLTEHDFEEVDLVSDEEDEQLQKAIAASEREYARSQECQTQPNQGTGALRKEGSCCGLDQNAPVTTSSFNSSGFNMNGVLCSSKTAQEVGPPMRIVHPGDEALAIALMEKEKLEERVRQLEKREHVEIRADVQFPSYWCGSPSSPKVQLLPPNSDECRSILARFNSTMLQGKLLDVSLVDLEFDSLLK
jgi:hypothetical protein